MDAREVTGEREFAVRFDYGEEWVAEIESFVAAADVESGWFHATGAVEDAELAYYDQDAFEYETVTYDEPLEVAACTGTIALDEDGEPSVDAHVVLSRPSGQTVSGALVRATVFDGELYCRTFEDALTRGRDTASGRELWE
ncbi:PPC domain-containing DNA-binding protein [Halarchaeum sp. P4]|uniref:PPC domain-containing DNA-binding protein n=1 Tax=Halarchaeum sp. P4 TaxID=3421639 RepID=UPI003EBA83D1